MNGILMPNNQRQHRTLRIQKVTVPRVSRSCEHFPDGFDLHLLHARNNLLITQADLQLFPHLRAVHVELGRLGKAKILAEKSISINDKTNTWF